MSIVLQPATVTTIFSTNTKIPRLTLFRKLASLPAIPPLWSASSEARLCSELATIASTVGPSRPPKLIPRYARYCVTKRTSLTSNTQSALVSPNCSSSQLRRVRKPRRVRSCDCSDSSACFQLAKRTVTSVSAPDLACRPFGSMMLW